MHSTSYSNASAISSQQNGKWLQRSLDIKVRKLRSLLTADEDITTELDRVVCRLMKLALKTSKDRNVPPPTTWLQCKLLDLLTLTERAIERRKRLLFNKNPLTVLAPEDQRQNPTFGRFPDINDNDSKNIVRRYTNYLQEADVKDKFNSATSDLHRYVSLEVEDDISVTSNEFVKTYDFNNRENSSSSMNSERNKGKKIKSRERDVSTHKQYHKTDNYSGVSSSGDTDHSIKINHQKRCKKTNKNFKKQSNNEDKSTKVEVIKDNKPKGNLLIKNEEHGGRKDRKRLLKRIVKKKNFCGYIFKHNQPFVECEHYKLRVKRKIRKHRQVKSILNPSLNNLTNVYQENINPKKTFNELINAICDKRGDPIFKSQESIAFTEQSCVIEIVTDKTSETISLRQTLATDANKCRSQHTNLLLPIKSEARLDSVSILTKNANCSISKLVLTAEKEESQAIFLYDINEPSTSKGVRHINIDAQCGPDTGFICPVPSVTSLSRNLINISDPDANKREEEFECIKSEDNKSFKDDNMLNPKIKTNGIQIKDSDNALKKTKENLALISIESLPIVSESASQLAMKLDYHISAVPESSIDANMGNCSKVSSDSVIIAKKISGAIREPPNLPKEIAIANAIPFSSPIQRKLTRGGIYIHSYKDKITSEDIIYQGDWQRLRPKKLAKNNPFDIIFVKKNAEQNNNKKKNKDHLIRKNRGGSDGNSSSNRECQQKINNIIVNKEQNLCTDSKKSVVARKTIKCLNKNLKQVSSKVTVSSVICKNTRNTQEVPKIIKTPQNTKREKKNKNSVKSYKSKDLPPCNPVYIKNRFHKKITQHPALEVNECHVKDYNFLKNLNIKNELLKFVRDPCHTISYSVFRNKIEKDAEGNRQSSPIKEIRNSKEFKSIRNMQSANSSSSSTNSIATIRQLSPQLQMRRKLPSKIKVNNLPKTTSPIRRINTTECTKKTSIIFDDKENDPQSSNYDNIQMKDSTQDLEKSKSIVIPRNSISKHKNKSSNISIKKPHEVNEKKFCTSSSSTSKKVSLADPIPNVVIKKQLHSDPNVSNLVLVLESYKKPPHVEEQKLTGCLQESENRKELDSGNNTVLSLVDDNGNYVTHDTPDIYHEMMNLVEESLNFIGEHSFIKHSKIGQGKQLSQGERNKNCEKVHFHETNENEAAASSLYSGSTQVNVDLISFKSFASVSGYSEYFLADSELSATLDSLQTTTSPKKSVHELFERNDQAHLPYSGTVQGFSGFSINEQLIGDQPDYVNLIDSETGSVARGMDLRRATSEEVFTSGRSSDTYVSCQVDEDTLVPQWLFHAINQQHSEEENEQQRILIPMPVVEPDLDINANIMERGVVAGAGAGDGRGIHSDQDSSGRDTSMSSTETSSGQQSEAVLVDPSAYATNIEFLREPSSRPFFQLGSSASPDSSFRTVEGSENDNAYSVSAGSTRNDLNLGMIQSDRDADVSSLDTDIADFSDN